MFWELFLDLGNRHGYLMCVFKDVRSLSTFIESPMNITKRKIVVNQSSSKIDETSSLIDSKKLFWRIIEILQRPSDIVFLDECGFDNF